VPNRRPFNQVAGRLASSSEAPVGNVCIVASIPAGASPLLDLPSMVVDRARVETTLRAAVQTSDDLLTEMASHLIEAGGKRLRPVMAIAAALTGHDAASDDVVRGGVAVELVQVGSLYHDDVMDEAELRRGAVSANARWGNHRAILAGDFLLARASEIAASLGAEVAGLLGATIGRLVEGQILELRTQYDPTRTEASYLASIEGKSASLFSTAARIGALVADLSREQIRALTACGLSYGMAFQMVDDVLDVIASEQELGKPSGHDMIEGVYTLPVIHTLAKAGPAGDELRDLLSPEMSAAEVDKALAIVRSNGGIAHTIVRAREYADQTADVMAPYIGTAAGRALASAAHAVVDTVADR
jgi:heptaprenyl diphosphate synthase